MNKIAIGTLIAICTAGGSGVLWYDNVQVERHDAIIQLTAEKRFSDNVEVTLELIEAKLKLYRTIMEHRELTADEQAEYDWLIERKRILTEKKTT